MADVGNNGARRTKLARLHQALTTATVQRALIDEQHAALRMQYEEDRAELATLNRLLTHRDATIDLLRRDTERLLDVVRAAQRLRCTLPPADGSPAYAIAAAVLVAALDAYEADPAGNER